MINGIINVYKEKGMTSFDVIYRLRKLFDQKKMGHTGTLDPNAEGVLPVCLGRATRLVDMLTDRTKTYETSLILGITTDTQDITGKVTKERPVEVAKSEVTDVISSFEGKMLQLPPMYSAVKVGGKKLVDLARRGIEVERKKREVEFFDLKIHSINLPRISFGVSCTKGSYIRTLCNDIGEKLGCGAVMDTLLRTRVGSFTLENAYTLGQIEALKRKEDLLTVNAANPYSFVIPLEDMFSHLPVFTAPPSGDLALINGNDFISDTAFEDCQEVRVHLSDGHFTGIYRYDEKSCKMSLVKYFYDSSEN